MAVLEDSVTPKEAAVFELDEVEYKGNVWVKVDGFSIIQVIQAMVYYDAKWMASVIVDALNKAEQERRRSS